MNTTYDHTFNSKPSGGSLIRPAWTPITIAMMIFGFMIFWPLGLAMLAYILWGDRLDEFKNSVNRTTDDISKKWGRDCGSYASHSKTGNVAFDDWRDDEIARLEAERRKLDEMRAEFDAHLRELRRAKDQDEFDAFMAAYKNSSKKKPASKSKKKTVPEV